GKIDEHATGINNVDAEAVRLKPGNDGIQVGLRNAEPFAKLLRREPVMEIRRTWSMEFLQKLLKGLLLFRRASQLQKHELHGEVAGDATAVVRKDSFRAGVAAQGDAIHLINSLGDLGLRDSGLRGLQASMSAGFHLRKNRRRSRQDGED